MTVIAKLIAAITISSTLVFADMCRLRGLSEDTGYKRGTYGFAAENKGTGTLSAPGHTERAGSSLNVTFYPLAAGRKRSDQLLTNSEVCRQLGLANGIFESWRRKVGDRLPRRSLLQ